MNKKAAAVDTLKDLGKLTETIDFKKPEAKTTEVVPEFDLNEPDPEEQNQSEKTADTTEEPPISKQEIKQAQETIDSSNGSIGMNLEDDFTGATEQDINKKTVSSTGNETVDNILGGFNDDDFIKNDVGEQDEDSIEYKRSNCAIKSSLLVEFIDIIMWIICSLIQGSFDDNSGYKLPKERKKVLKSNVYQLMMRSKKKHNPLTMVIMVIFFSYVPMLGMAIYERYKKGTNKAPSDPVNENLNMKEVYRNDEFKAKPIPPNIYGSPLKNVKEGNTLIGDEDKLKPIIRKFFKKNKHRALVNPNNPKESYSGSAGKIPKWVYQYFRSKVAA